MAKHEFGIMEQAPGLERYDVYEPEHFGCISLGDEWLEGLLPLLDNIPCFWHTRQRPAKGLAYCGITLIPPQSLERFLCVFQAQDNAAYDGVIALFQRAIQEGKYVIHYGL